METRERTIERAAGTGPGAGGTQGAGTLEGLREAGERLLDAGDRAIERVLSMDSEKFLAATRQEGGQ
jgi:hypothetical protein